MIIPRLKDETLLADVQAAPDDDENIHLWWLGQSGFLLKWGREYALFDPYLSDSLTRKYAGTATPHVRMTERCISPEALGYVRTVFVSHLHTDHCDPATLIPLLTAINRQRGRLRLITPRGILTQVQTRLGSGGIDFHALDADEPTEPSPWRVTAIPAAHPTVALDAQGHNCCVGFLVSAGPWRIFHSGDTVLHPGLVPRLVAAQPDVVLLPINGNDPQRGVPGNLDGMEAANLAKTCGASVAIPHHFDMFEFNTVKPDHFVIECNRLQQRCQVLQCGEQWSSAGLKPRSSL